MRSLLASFALIAVVLAAPSKDCVHKVKETVAPPRQWVKEHAAPKDLTIELKIALPQPNFSELERHLTEIRLVCSNCGCRRAS